MFLFRRISRFSLLLAFSLVFLSCGSHLSERLPNLSASKGSGGVSRDLAQNMELAIQKGQISEVEAFLRAGFPVNQLLNTGYTPLQQAIVSTHPIAFEAMFTALMAKGADPLLRDAKGNSALDLAQGKRVALRLLQPERNNELLKQLFANLEAETDRSRIVSFFTSEGEDVNVIEPESGHTPLTLAISLKSRRLFGSLVQDLVSDIDINKRNGKGVSPLRLAKEKDNEWTLAVTKLTELGAKE